MEVVFRYTARDLTETTREESSFLSSSQLWQLRLLVREQQFWADAAFHSIQRIFKSINGVTAAAERLGKLGVRGGSEELLVACLLAACKALY